MRKNKTLLKIANEIASEILKNEELISQISDEERIKELKKENEILSRIWWTKFSKVILEKF
jgi:hypothetical protein